MCCAFSLARHSSYAKDHDHGYPTFNHVTVTLHGAAGAYLIMLTFMVRNLGRSLAAVCSALVSDAAVGGHLQASLPATSS